MNNEINIKLNFNSVNVVDTTKNLNVKILMVKGEKGDPGSLSNNYGTSSEDGYSQDYLNDKLVNVGTSEDSNYRTNILSSRNIFNINTIPSWFGSDTTYSVSNNILNVSGKYFAGFLMNVAPNTTYYVKATRTINTSTTNSGSIRIFQSNQSTAITSHNTGNFSFNSGNNTQVYVLFYAGSGSNGDVNFSNIIISEEDISYEPYIQKSINVDNTKFSDTINVGTSINNSNRVNVLFNPNLTQTTTYTSGYRLNGDGTLLNETSYSVSDYIEVKENTDYIFNKDRIQYYNRVCFFDSDKTCIGQNSGTSATFTTPADTKYIRYGWITIELTSLILEEGTSILTPSINIDGEEIYSKPVVLWSNPSPRTQFASQTITLNDNISNYKYIDFIYYDDVDANNIYTNRIYFYQTKARLTAFIFYSNNLYFRQRAIQKSNDTQIAINDNQQFYINNPATTTQNNGCIPHQIIGYK